jgi:hypothetical protein
LISRFARASTSSIQQFLDGGEGDTLTADLPSTEAENADVHVCFTQLAVFHIPSLKKNWTRFNRYRAYRGIGFITIFSGDGVHVVAKSICQVNGKEKMSG